MAKSVYKVYSNNIRKLLESNGLDSDFASCIKNKIEIVYLKKSISLLDNNEITKSDLIDIITHFINPTCDTFNSILPYHDVIFYNKYNIHFSLPFIVDFFRLVRKNIIPKKYYDFIINTNFAYLFNDQEEAVEHNIKVKIELIYIILNAYYYKNQNSILWLKQFVEHNMHSYGKLRYFTRLSKMIYLLNLNEQDIQDVFSLAQTGLLDSSTLQILADILSKKNNKIIEEEDVQYIIFQIDMDKVNYLIKNKQKTVLDIQDDIYKELLYRYHAFLLSNRYNMNKKTKTWLYNFITNTNDILSKIYQLEPMLRINLNALNFKNSYVRYLLKEYDGIQDEEHLIKSDIINRILEKQLNIRVINQQD